MLLISSSSLLSQYHLLFRFESLLIFIILLKLFWSLLDHVHVISITVLWLIRIKIHAIIVILLVSITLSHRIASIEIFYITVFIGTFDFPLELTINVFKSFFKILIFIVFNVITKHFASVIVDIFVMFLIQFFV